jgi:PAS domain S-box-containing protein
MCGSGKIGGKFGTHQAQGSGGPSCRQPRSLADSEARFRATFENAAVGIAHVALDGRWLRVNQALCRIVGYPADELLTKSFQDVPYRDDLASDLAQAKLMREGKIDTYDVEKRYLRMRDCVGPEDCWLRTQGRRVNRLSRQRDSGYFCAESS